MSKRVRGEDANVGRRDVLRLLRAERIAQAQMKPMGRKTVRPMLPA